MLASVGNTNTSSVAARVLPVSWRRQNHPHHHCTYDRVHRHYRPQKQAAYATNNVKDGQRNGYANVDGAMPIGLAPSPSNKLMIIDGAASIMTPVSTSITAEILKSCLVFTACTRSATCRRVPGGPWEPRSTFRCQSTSHRMPSNVESESQLRVHSRKR
jgi:hypothetical protein